MSQKIGESLDLIKAVEPQIKSLMDSHNSRRKHWYAHELIPWEQAQNYRDKPWDESQVTLNDSVRTALVLNLLTEDNLPYYHAKIAGNFPEDSALNEWSGMWTAEEGQHSIAIRDYLLTSRNCDPRLLEDQRMVTVRRGWQTQLSDPLDILAYTSAQELATRISHRNAGAKADDPIAFELMTRVATDENHHFLFYRGVVTAMLRHAPGTVIRSLHRVFSEFRMPGDQIPSFKRRAVKIAKAGIYNLRIHAEQVVDPLLRHWKVANIGDLSGKDAEAQDKLLDMPNRLIAEAEIFETRLARNVA